MTKSNVKEELFPLGEQYTSTTPRFGSSNVHINIDSPK